MKGFKVCLRMKCGYSICLDLIQLKHVLTDKRVLAMVQNAIAESEEQSTTAVRVEPNFVSFTYFI